MVITNYYAARNCFEGSNGSAAQIDMVESSNEQWVRWYLVVAMVALELHISHTLMHMFPAQEARQRSEAMLDYSSSD